MFTNKGSARQIHIYRCLHMYTNLRWVRKDAKIIMVSEFKDVRILIATNRLLHACSLFSFDKHTFVYFVHETHALLIKFWSCSC